MENHHVSFGKSSYFIGTIFNSKLLNCQRLPPIYVSFTAENDMNHWSTEFGGASLTGCLASKKTMQWLFAKRFAILSRKILRYSQWLTALHAESIPKKVCPWPCPWIHVKSWTSNASSTCLVPKWLRRDSGASTKLYSGWAESSSAKVIQARISEACHREGTRPDQSWRLFAHCGNPRRSALNSCCTTAQSGSNSRSFCNMVLWGSWNCDLGRPRIRR